MLAPFRNSFAFWEDWESSNNKKELSDRQNFSIFLKLFEAFPSFSFSRLPSLVEALSNWRTSRGTGSSNYCASGFGTSDGVSKSSFAFEIISIFYFFVRISHLQVDSVDLFISISCNITKLVSKCMIAYRTYCHVLLHSNLTTDCWGIYTSILPWQWCPIVSSCLLFLPGHEDWWWRMDHWKCSWSESVRRRFMHHNMVTISIEVQSRGYLKRSNSQTTLKSRRGVNHKECT